MSNRVPVVQQEVRLIVTQAEQRVALAYRHSRLHRGTLSSLWESIAQRRLAAGDHAGYERARRAARNAR